MKRRRINPTPRRPRFWFRNISSRERAGRTDFINSLRHAAARRIQRVGRQHIAAQRRRYESERYMDRVFDRYGSNRGADWDHPHGRGLYEDY